MNVPKLYINKSQAIKGNSFDTLLEICDGLGLGFATNLEDTNDDQTWLNSNRTTETYMKDILEHAYIDDESFVTGFIDPYYVFNFVEVNRLFSQEGEKEDTYIYPAAPFDMAERAGEDPNPKETYLGKYELTNDSARKIMSNYFDAYSEKTNAGSEIKKGYKKYNQYFDIINKEFISEFIDPLTTNTEGMVPITKGSTNMKDIEKESPHDYLASSTYYGIQGDNCHSEYYYAAVLNNKNISEMNKFGLKLHLRCCNLMLTRYSRIYVDMFESINRLGMGAQDIDGRDPDNPKDVPPQFPDYGEGNESLTDPNAETGTGVHNEALSGWYVITGITYKL